MEAIKKPRGTGNFIPKTSSITIADERVESTSDIKDVSGTTNRKEIRWGDVASDLYDVSTKAVNMKGAFLSQVVGNFTNPPEEGFFKNEFDIGCMVIVDKDQEGMLLIYNDGTQHKFTK